VSECDWVETRLGIKLESQRDSRRPLAREKLYDINYMIVCWV